jgi:hypothetical protein
VLGGLCELGVGGSEKAGTLCTEADCSCSPCQVVWGLPIPCPAPVRTLRRMHQHKRAHAVKTNTCAAVNTPTAGDRHDAVYTNTTDADIKFCPGSRTHFEFFQREVGVLSVHVS